jgi:hypothetical protein
MESSGSRRSGLLTAGGVLSILAGTFQIIGGVLPAVFPELRVRYFFWWVLQSGPDLGGKDIGRLALIAQPPSPVWWLIGFILIILGVIAIVGGVWAIRRRSFGLSLAGAICALPSVVFGWYIAVAALTEVGGISLPPAMAICGLALVILGILAVVFVSVSKSEFGGEGKENGVSGRGKLLTAGGVLSIIDGALEVTGGGIMVGLVVANRELFGLVGHGVWGGTPGIRSSLFGDVELIWLINVGVPLLVLGVVGIVGGVSAIRRRGFGLSLAGAICVLPSVIFALPLGWAIGIGVIGALTSLILGILAVIFVALGKREFGAKA